MPNCLVQILLKDKDWLERRQLGEMNEMMRGEIGEWRKEMLTPKKPNKDV